MQLASSGLLICFFSLLCVFFTKLIFFLYSATTTATYNDNDDEQQVVACPDDATRIGWAFGMFFFFKSYFVFLTSLIFSYYGDVRQPKNPHIKICSSIVASL